MKKILSIIALTAILTMLGVNTMLLYGCDKTASGKVDPKYATEYTNSDNPRVTINMTDGKSITVELYPEVAPLAVARFLECCNDGFYNNKVYHRIISGFVVQGGGLYYEGNNLLQAPTNKYPSIKGEFALNGVDNPLKHLFGVIAFGRLGGRTEEEDALYYDSTTVQFYLCLADLPSLDNRYTTFGRIIDQSSADVLSAYGNVETTGDDNNNVPLKPITIKNTKIDWRKYKQNYLK